MAIFLTPGTTPPTGAQLLTLPAIPTSFPATTNVAPFRDRSATINAAPGPYVVTITPSAVPSSGPRIVLAQQQITLVSGEVRTFVVQNTAATGAPANYKLTALVDAQS
jgi:hypothetical protein